MPGYTAMMGREPRRFQISYDKAVIPAEEHEVQMIIDLFKTWLPIANRKYEETIRREKKQAEEELRRHLELEIEQKEDRQRVLERTKL